MQVPISADRPNQILAALPAEEYDRLVPHLKLTELSLGHVLYETDDPIDYVYFPSTSVVSLVTHMKDGASIEVGIVGKEGMVGITVIMGDPRAPNQAIVQIADGAMRMKARILQEEFKRPGELQRLLLRYTRATLRQACQTAACNRSHHIGRRLARWLLACQDRVGDNELKLTQEFIAEMLGTRRQGVTEAANLLREAKLLRYVRGHITILDRKGLEKFACECYEVIKTEFDRARQNESEAAADAVSLPG
jgi:CRP-like cAMP-binding protein